MPLSTESILKVLILYSYSACIALSELESRNALERYNIN